MAGPLASQLLHTTTWGDLDYLIIDTPPGTGDVPRAIATKVPLHGALVVTTPSRLAVVDVLRGINQLTRLKVPILGVVENMASFRCASCGTDHYPFGRGLLDEVVQSIDQPGECPSFRLPIVPSEQARGMDEGAIGLDSCMRPHFQELAAAIEGATEAAKPVMLPHEMIGGFHELPHWPTVMATNELYR